MRFIFFTLLFLTTLLNASEHLVANKSVSYLLGAPEEEGEIETQAIYGSKVEMIEKQEKWALVQMEDGEKAWIEFDHLERSKKYLENSNLYSIKSLFAHVYRDPDTSTCKPITTLPFGAKIHIVEPLTKPTRWLKVELIDGKEAWIQSGDLNLDPKPISLEEMIKFSKRFLALPYTWGGNSSFGYDCSGFVQMLFKQMGIIIPRNSRQQAASDLFKEISRQDLKPGDLIFFGESKITHVGMYLGEDAFIHSGVRDGFPGVHISNLNDTEYNFIIARRLKQIL